MAKTTAICLSHGGPKQLIVPPYRFRPGVPVVMPNAAARRLLARHDGTNEAYGRALLYKIKGKPESPPAPAPAGGPHPDAGGPPVSPAEILAAQAATKAATERAEAAEAKLAEIEAAKAAETDSETVDGTTTSADVPTLDTEQG